MVTVVLRSCDVHLLYRARQQLSSVAQGDAYVPDLQNRVLQRRLFGLWGSELVKQVCEGHGLMQGKGLSKSRPFHPL